MGWPEAILSLTLLGDRAMARLNRETFGRRGPTNVISFPMDVEQAPSPVHLQPRAAVPHPSGPPMSLGEVVISIATTRRQAKESGWPWQELFDFFLIHGILHLLGYEHDSPEAEEDMNAKTWELMKLLHPKIVISDR